MELIALFAFLVFLDWFIEQLTFWNVLIWGTITAVVVYIKIDYDRHTKPLTPGSGPRSARTRSRSAGALLPRDPFDPRIVVLDDDAPEPPPMKRDDLMATKRVLRDCIQNERDCEIVYWASSTGQLTRRRIRPKHLGQSMLRTTGMEGRDISFRVKWIRDATPL